MKRKWLPEIVFFLIVLLVFIVNSSYVSYPDEFVNLLGGKFINAGKIPYKEFFDHHLPFAWYFAAVLLKFSFGSFILFRLYWAIFIFVLLAILGLWIRKNYKNLYPYYLVFFLLHPLVSIYFWLHLYLADNLATLLFIMVFWLLFPQTIEGKINYKVILISSFLTFSLIFSSLTFVYLALTLYVWQFHLLLRAKIRIKNIVFFILFNLAPYLIYILYLLITSSLSDFLFANFTYNTKLYIDIPNYTLGRFFNPLKFGFTLIFNFWEGFLPRLATIRDLNLYLPVATLTVLGNITLLILLTLKNIFGGFIFFFLLSFSAPRSNLQKAMFETDYQVGLFIVLGIAASIFAIYLLRKLEVKDVLINDFRRLGQLLISVLLLFTFLFLLKNTYNKWYLRYTQKIPSIFDKADVAQFLDEILDEGDYYWVGPYEPHEVFFVKKGRLPGKYAVLLPQYKQSEYLKKTFIEQFEKHLPMVIVFKKDTGIFGTPTYLFGDFFLAWMKDKYTPLEDIKDIKILKDPTSVKLDSHLYLLNSEKDKLLRRLKTHGYI